MTPSELAEIFEQSPDQPFKLTLASGDEVVVPSPRRTIVSSLALHVGITDNPRSLVMKRIRYISIPNIVMIEQIEQNRPGRRRRS